MARTRADAGHIPGYRSRCWGARSDREVPGAVTRAGQCSSDPADAQRIRQWRIRREISFDLNERARRLNPTLRGRLNDYGRFYESARRRSFAHLDQQFRRRAQRKCSNVRDVRLKVAADSRRGSADSLGCSSIGWPPGKVTVRTKGAVRWETGAYSPARDWGALFPLYAPPNQNDHHTGSGARAAGIAHSWPIR